MSTARSAHATHGTSPLELIEEAVQDLRGLPGSAHAAFLVGTVPCVLGMLWFWADMSRGAWADRRCAQGSAVVALLYVWMKAWHAVHAEALRVRLAATEASPWTLRRWLRCAAVQGALQPWGLLLVPASLLPLMLPFPWVFAFFRHVDAEAGAPDVTLGQACRRAWREARRWPGQNHGLLGLLPGLAVVVLVNLALAMSQLPGFLRMLTGWENEFTLSLGSLVLNSTFLLSVVGVAYVVLMPLILAVYTRRGFEGAAIRDGADLRAGLARLRRGGGRVGVILGFFALAVAVGWGGASSGCAADAAAPVPARVGIDPTALDRSIDQVLSRPDFAWRTRREMAGDVAGPEAPRGWVDSVVHWLTGRLTALGRALKSPVVAIGRAVESLLEWLFRSRTTPAPARPSGRDAVDWMSGVKLVAYGVLAVAVGLLARQAHRLWRRRQRRGTPPAEAPGPRPVDLTAEQVSPAALPEEGWLQLAREMAGRGEFRLATRAIYLAELAHLAGREWVRLADAKSNRDYQRELERRTRAWPALGPAFADTVRAFDQVWYGRHVATAESLAAMEARFRFVQSVVGTPEGGGA